MADQIDVHDAGEEGGSPAFDVHITGSRGATQHRVTVSRHDLRRLARQDEEPAAFVRRCFEFLLDREPKESILRRFDVAEIGRYFPEFEAEIRR